MENVGDQAFELPPASPTYHPVVAFVYLPGNTFGESAVFSCAGWGPYPEGWGWEDPGRASHQYACLSGLIAPGATVWFDLVVNITKQSAGAPGRIELAAPFNGRSAPIVVRTRGPATLPVTGPDAAFAAMLGGSLTVLGLALLAVTLRRRRVR